MPPFFIPILAFGLWALILASTLPVLRLDLSLSDQFLPSQFFISYLILLFAWALSGPGVAAALSCLAAVFSVYLCLSLKEPAFLLQIPAYSALFLFTAFYLQKSQRRTRNLDIAAEKTVEELNLARKEIDRLEARQKALKRKIDHFLDLQHFASALKEASGFDGVAALIVREAGLVLEQADECVLYLVNESRQALDLIARHPGTADDAVEKAGRVFDHWVMRQSQAVMIEDTRDDFRFTSETKPDLDDWRSVCACPLVIENRVFGVIRANARRPAAFTADDLRLLDVFSSLGAVSLRNALLYRDTEELAAHDGLTGLFVNRLFQERLEEALRAAEAAKSPLSVVLLDIDYFKSYNDEYGHSAGDLVLKNIGAILARFAEAGGQAGAAAAPRHSTGLPHDGIAAARYGGEEFALLLPGKAAPAAMALAEAVRVEIEKTVFVIRRLKRRVTASFGVSTYPADGRTKEAILWAADKRLYEAKNKGRNRVCGGI